MNSPKKRKASENQEQDCVASALDGNESTRKND